MITIDNKESLVSVAVLGEFTLADFREFEEAVLEQAKADAPVDICLDLREMADFTVDMAWEEFKFSRQHGSEFRRVAVLTNSQFVAMTAWLEQAFVSAALRVFRDEDEAAVWLAEKD